MNLPAVQCDQCGTSIHYPGGAEVPEFVTCIQCGAQVAFASRIDPVVLAEVEAAALASDDSVPVVCKVCDTRMLVPEEQIGQQIDCAMCGSTVTVQPTKEREKSYTGEGGEFRLSAPEPLPEEARKDAQPVRSLLSAWCGCGHRNRPRQEFAEKEIQCLKCGQSLLVPPIIDSVLCKCGQSIAYTAQMQGRKQKCSNCNHVLRIPPDPRVIPASPRPAAPAAPVSALNATAQAAAESADEPTVAGFANPLSSVTPEQRRQMILVGGVAGGVLVLLVLLSSFFFAGRTEKEKARQEAEQADREGLPAGWIRKRFAHVHMSIAVPEKAEISLPIRPAIGGGIYDCFSPPPSGRYMFAFLRNVHLRHDRKTRLAMILPHLPTRFQPQGRYRDIIFQDMDGVQYGDRDTVVRILFWQGGAFVFYASKVTSDDDVFLNSFQRIES